MGVPSEYFMSGRSVELVGLAVGGDLRHVLRQPGDDLGALLALGVLIGEQRGVGVVQHLPSLDGVRELRVDVVGERRHRDVHLAAAISTAATAPSRPRRRRRRRWPAPRRRQRSGPFEPCATCSCEFPWSFVLVCEARSDWLDVCPRRCSLSVRLLPGAIASFPKYCGWQLGLSGMDTRSQPARGQSPRTRSARDGRVYA